MVELRSFLGFASYYRRFVEGFAKLAAPLHKLVATLAGTKSRRGSGQVLGDAWTSHCEESFEALKSRLISAPVLNYADFSRPFILEIDASYSGLVERRFFFFSLMVERRFFSFSCRPFSKRKP